MSCILMCVWIFVPTMMVTAQMPRCEKITAPNCQRLGYNTTLMPNFVGHTNQQQATKGLQAFQPLLHYNCSQHLRLFVCSVFVPLCSVHVPGAVPACRGLCEAVHDECLPVLNTFELPWPAELECSRFPSPPELCMQLPTSDESEQTITNDDYAGAASSSSSSSSSSDAVSHCPPRFVGVDDGCVPACGADAYYRREDKELVQVWTAVAASAGALIAAFTLLTFCIDRTRFQYPERPALFLSLCCLAYSAFVLARTALGAEAVTCDSGRVVGRASDNALCALSAFALHYLALAMRLWFGAFCACWYLHAAREWSNEALTELGGRLHAAVYGAAAVPSVLALLAGAATADELTGACELDERGTLWFTVLPHALCLCVALVASARTAGALKRIRTSLMAGGRSTAKLERLMLRLGVFVGVLAAIEVTFLVCTVYETRHRPRWRSLALLSALDCGHDCGPEPLYRTASTEAVLLRATVSTLLAAPSLMWVCSGKTCKTWGDLFYVPRTKV